MDSESSRGLAVFILFICGGSVATNVAFLYSKKGSLTRVKTSGIFFMVVSSILCGVASFLTFLLYLTIALTGSMTPDNAAEDWTYFIFGLILKTFETTISVLMMCLSIARFNLSTSTAPAEQRLGASTYASIISSVFCGILYTSVVTVAKSSLIKDTLATSLKGLTFICQITFCLAPTCVSLILCALLADYIKKCSARQAVLTSEATFYKRSLKIVFANIIVLVILKIPVCILRIVNMHLQHNIEIAYCGDLFLVVLWFCFPVAQGLINFHDTCVCLNKRRVMPLEPIEENNKIFTVPDALEVIEEDQNETSQAPSENHRSVSDFISVADWSTCDDRDDGALNAWDDLDTRSVATVATSSSYKAKLMKLARESGNYIPNGNSAINNVDLLRWKKRVEPDRTVVEDLRKQRLEKMRRKTLSANTRMDNQSETLPPKRPFRKSTSEPSFFVKNKPPTPLRKDSVNAWDDLDTRSILSVATSCSYKEKLRQIAQENGNLSPSRIASKPSNSDIVRSKLSPKPSYNDTIHSRLSQGKDDSETTLVQDFSDCEDRTIRRNTFSNSNRRNVRGTTSTKVIPGKRPLRKSSSEPCFYSRSKSRLQVPKKNARTVSFLVDPNTSQV